VLSLSIALASLVIVIAVIILACFRLSACRHRQQQHQQQHSASRRSSLAIDMPPPYPGPFIPGQTADLVSAHEAASRSDDSWRLEFIGVADGEACGGGGVDVVEKTWPPVAAAADDDEGHFVPDAVEMNAKLEEAIPPPPHLNYDQRRHHRHRNHRDAHHHHPHPQQKQQGKNNDCFVLDEDDDVLDRSRAVQSLGFPSPAAANPAAWRRQVSAPPTANTGNVSLSTSGNMSGGSSSPFVSGSSPRQRSTPSFCFPSSASSSLSSQSPMVLSDDADTTKTSVDYY